MKKLIFLMIVGIIGLSCSAKVSTSTSSSSPTPAANKPAPAATTPPADKPKTDETKTDKPDAPEKTDNKSNPDLDFTIVNKTGYDIKELSIGATGTGDWAKEDEVLKGRKFANGDALDIKFNPRATAAKWDIKVEWTDGSKGVEWTNLNLTQIEKVTLTYDRETDKTTANIE